MLHRLTGKIIWAIESSHACAFRTARLVFGQNRAGELNSAQGWRPCPGDTLHVPPTPHLREANDPRERMAANAAKFYGPFTDNVCGGLPCALFANMPPGRPAKAAGPSAVAYLTSTNAGCLMSLVLRVSDQRLVGGRLIVRELEPTCEAMVRTRLQALATRLSRESSAPSVIGDHIQEAARVLDAVLRRRRPPEECVLSARTLRIATEILGSDLGRAIHMPEVASACGDLGGTPAAGFSNLHRCFPKAVASGKATAVLSQATCRDG